MKGLRYILYPLALLYGSLGKLHRACYRIGLLSSKSFDIPIINVGNLSVGGTGKSPHVAYFNDWLAAIFTTAIVSRGYHRKTKGVQLVLEDSSVENVGDEPLQLKQRFPNTMVVVAEHRASGIDAAIKADASINCILLDDAFQHWAIQASFQVLLTTFDAPFFDDNVLPMGRLREFKNGYQRADIIIITKCPPSITAAQKEIYYKKIKPFAHQQVFFSYFKYQTPYSLLEPQNKKEIEELKGQPILLVTAIARTSYLEDYVNSSASSVKHLKFSDHHFYNKKDLEKIEKAAQGGFVITTEKDATKLKVHQSYIKEVGLQIYVLPIEVVIAFDKAALLKNVVLESLGQKNSC